MERREPSTLPVYAKANLKPPFTSMHAKACIFQENFAGDVLINGKKRTIHVACIFQGQFEVSFHINAE